MMLRTTIVSKIKKVCTVAFVPRILRGDLRYTPCKFETFPIAVVQRKAQKSTRSSDDEKYNDSAEFILVSKETNLPKEKKNKNDGDSKLEVTSKVTEETHYEKYQRLIDEAFGKEDKRTGPVLTQQYYSQGVNIEETRRKIDENELARRKLESELNLDKPVTQCSVFKEKCLNEPSDLDESSLNAISKKGNPDLLELEENSIEKQTLNYTLTSARLNYSQTEKVESIHNYRNVNLPNELDAETAAANEFRQKNNDHILNMYKQDLIKDSSFETHAEEMPQSVDSFGSEARNVDNIQEHEKLERLFFNVHGHFDDHLKENEEQLAQKPPNTIKQDPEYNVHNDEIHIAACQFRENFNNSIIRAQAEVERIFFNQHGHYDDRRILHVTTAKENEEQLAQKLEHIDETPLVEAQKPKIEGFNVTPKILGNGPTYTCNCFGDKISNNHKSGVSPGLDIPSSFDEVAKRCLDTPTGKIDEILLKEMEKLGIPVTTTRVNRGRSPVIEEDLVQMDILKKQQQIEKKDIDLESHEYERGAVELCSAEKMCPPHVTCSNVCYQKDFSGSEKTEKSTHFDPLSRITTFIKPNQEHIDRENKATANEAIRPDCCEYFSNAYTRGDKPAKTYIRPLSPSVNLKPRGREIKDKDDINILNVTKNLENAWNEERNKINSATETMNNNEMSQNIWAESPDLGDKEMMKKEEMKNVEIDKISSLEAHEISKTQKMWNEEQQDAKVIDGGLDNAQIRISSQDEVQLDPKTTEETIKRTDSTCTSDKYPFCVPEGTFRTLNPIQGANKVQLDSKQTEEHFCVPDGIWQTIKSPNTIISRESESRNKTNINVSDDIWDEQIELETKQKQKFNISTELWDQEQLDPKVVLTCNETCPIPPGSPGGIHKFDDLAGTEAIFDKDLAQPEISSMPQTNILDLDKQYKRLSMFLKSDPTVKSLATKPRPLITGSFSETLCNLPKLDEDVSLSELLRRVRERNRILECMSELKALGVDVEPVHARGKCNRKAPRCLPMAPRMPTNPIPPPSFGLPKLKLQPNACKPAKKCHKKFSRCEMDVSSSLRLGPKICALSKPVACSEMVCEMKDTGCEASVRRLKADLTEEVIDRLQTLGTVLGRVLRQGVDALVRDRGCKILMARDYEPWAPIPSWPDPKKPLEKKPNCSPGCKIFPPPRSVVDPPCQQSPCKYPKKTFSLSDCFAVSLGANKIYDLGEF